jgi:hypothetical protein
MKFNRVLPIVYILIGVFSCPFSTAHAGWFGPSNYNECILDKIDKRFLSNLQVLDIEYACRHLFALDPDPPKPAPDPPKPEQLDDKFIKYSNCADAAGNYSICINEKPSAKTNITSVTGYFINKQPCQIEAGEDWSRWLSLAGKKTAQPDVFTFEIAPDRANCVYMRFFGFAN